MTEEEQRIVLAKAMQWQKTPYNDTDYYVPMPGKPYVACDPLHDLNAMHQAEKVLTENQKCIYLVNLYRANPKWTYDWSIGFSTAAQRAEAFLKTIGKWVDSPKLVPA